MKKSIGKRDYLLLKRELTELAGRGEITGEQLERILGGYEVRPGRTDYPTGFSFIRILVTIGALLIGLGVLSFIASNWLQIGKPFKFLLIVSLYLVVNYAGYRLAVQHPKTARGLIYLGALVYGAGVFLIGQMFHYGGHFSLAFFVWAAGILPVTVVLRDRILFVFAAVLFLAYLNGYAASVDRLPLLAAGAMPVLYYLNARYFANDNVLAFFNNLVALNALLVLLLGLHLPGTYVLLIFFAVGLALYLVPRGVNRTVFAIHGNLIFGITGVALTFRHAWYAVFPYHSGDSTLAFSIIFAVCFAGLLLYLVRKESLVSLVFLCLLIFRYYADTMYDFLPKSLFFVLSGLLLLGFGWYIGRKRRTGGGSVGAGHPQ